MFVCGQESHIHKPHAQSLTASFATNIDEPTPFVAAVLAGIIWCVQSCKLPGKHTVSMRWKMLYHPKWSWCWAAVARCCSPMWCWRYRAARDTVLLPAGASPPSTTKHKAAQQTHQSSTYQGTHPNSSPHLL